MRNIKTHTYLNICLAILVFAIPHDASVMAGPLPTVKTTGATPLGTTAITVNGRVHPHAVPTRYWFEYGPTAEYAARSEPRDVPPKLAAFYHESWDNVLAGWAGGMSAKDLVRHPSGGASRGFVRFSEPSGLDPNHIDGIGWLHLATYFHCGWYPNGEGTNVFLAAGTPDLRDARVSIHVRGNDWHPNGSQLLWWTQSQTNDEDNPDPRMANWAYTGYSLNDFLRSGEWEHVEYTLRNDSNDWTYAGNNVAQQREIYSYGPIDDAQRSLNTDFFHLLAFVDPNEPPRGTLDFDEFKIAYRNYSLLVPSNGGRLRASPADSPDDPAMLTDGWRNGEGHMWSSAPDPAGPLEFVYEFVRPVTIQAVQVHQHSRWPTRDVEISTSSDGTAWTLLIQGEIPEGSPAGPNSAFLMERKLSVQASHLKVRVLSGYKPKHWGLGEIEVFGAGAVMRPDDEEYHVNQDLPDLTPGRTCHYRLVAENETGVTYGNDRTFVVPADTRPHVVIAKAARITAASAELRGRMSPLGKSTQYFFEYGPGADYGQRTAMQYGGLQITPRSVIAIVTGLRPATTYHYRLVAENETGTSYSDDATFMTAEE